MGIRRRPRSNARKAKANYEQDKRFCDGCGSWLWELAALAICTTSLLAMIAVVSISRGNPPHIFPLGIGLNALIAIFSTIMKTTMLFCTAESISQSKWIWFRQSRRLSDVQLYDEASRGLWGALMILGGIRW